MLEIPVVAAGRVRGHRLRRYHFAPGEDIRIELCHRPLPVVARAAGAQSTEQHASFAGVIGGIGA